MAKISRLSDQNVSDSIYRGFLYDEIIAGDIPNSIEYEIKPDELFRPDLVSYRIFATPDLAWMVLVAAGVDDPSSPMQFSQKLILPPASWVRSRIIHWSNGGETKTSLVNDSA